MYQKPGNPRVAAVCGLTVASVLAAPHRSRSAAVALVALAVAAALATGVGLMLVAAVSAPPAPTVPCAGTITLSETGPGIRVGARRCLLGGHGFGEVVHSNVLVSTQHNQIVAEPDGKNLRVGNATVFAPLLQLPDELSRPRSAARRGMHQPSGA